MIDVSFCNSIISIFEDPVGSGNYKAKFEVILILNVMGNEYDRLPIFSPEFVWAKCILICGTTVSGPLSQGNVPGSGQGGT